MEKKAKGNARQAAALQKELEEKQNAPFELPKLPFT